jgi:FixJ family two-component response regulator
MTERPTVFVVDDEPSVRVAIERLVGSTGLRCETFRSAEDYLQSERPDAPGCLVLDVRMPGWSGLDLQQMLRTAGQQRPIIFLSAHADIPQSVQAMKAGAVEFLTKPFNPQELLDAIQQAIDRDSIGRARRAKRDEIDERYRSLSPREGEVLACVVAGLANKETALKLDISVRTVKAHRAEVMRKMRADSVADLVRMAQALGVLPSDA